MPRFGAPVRDFDPKLKMRDRMRRDVAIPQNVGPSNNLPVQQALAGYGWCAEAFGAMGNTARWAVSLNPDNEIVAGGTLPLETLSQTPASLLNQCYIACLGSGLKAYEQQLGSTTAAVPLNLNPTGLVAFGARVRVTDTVTNFAFATYEIQLLNNTAVQAYVLVNVTSLPLDIMILSIQDAGGKATVVSNGDPIVNFPWAAAASAVGTVGLLNATAMKATNVLYAESLNMRDIGNILAAVGSGAIAI